ncbi:MAG: ABC transporter substrate-binding protein [Chloroflexi bacterium]|nr:ABC transporter substrate-binding protein [Chloroflexota bacterium]
MRLDVTRRTTPRRRIAAPFYVIVILALAGALLAACAAPEDEAPAGEGGTPTDVTLMLDWVPNTNHTGIFVAESLGYFEEAGLNVEIVQPGEVLAEQAVSAGAVEFGVSFQEQVTLARALEGSGIVSIAAIMQHNTSGFASPAELGISSPADWEGLTYGAFGSPFEEPTLAGLMECAGADFSALNMVNVGFADPLALLDEGQVDVAWIFYGWQGFQAAQQGVELDIVMLDEWFDCIPDYYTPIFITNEDMIAENPEVVAAFLEAVARGYEYAIDNPDEAATILLDAVPELNEEVVRESQAWVSPRYAADAPQWGWQTEERWQAYGDWMIESGIIEGPFDAASAFTTEFLPER